MYLLAKIIISTALLFSTCYVSGGAETPVTEVEEEPRQATEATQKTSESRPRYRVVGVNDGDTITVFDEDQKKQLKIRLATIDAPEYTQPFGRKSRSHLSDLVFKKHVSVNSYGKDRYGRMIGEIFIDGKNVNVAQIKSGYAWHYKRHQKQQTFKQRLIYSQAQNEAKEKRLGLWQYENPIPPWAYRKRNPRNQRADKFRKSEN